MLRPTLFTYTTVFGVFVAKRTNFGSLIRESYTDAMSDDSSGSDLLVTIDDLLDDPTLSIQPAYVPAAARSTPVSWVHATEQIDPRPHLRRNELVCTLGSSLVEARAAQRFVEAVADAGVAGIALGLGEVHLEPPKPLIEACTAAELPLLLIPHGVPFLVVNDAVLRRRSERESEARRQETILLSRLFVLARAGESEDDLLNTVRSSLGCEVVERAHSNRLEFHMSPGAKVPSTEFIDQLSSLLEFARRENVREMSERHQQVGQLIDLISKGLAHPAAAVPELDQRGLDASAMRVSSWPRGSEQSITTLWPTALIGVTGRETIVITGDEPLDDLMSLGLVCGYSSVVALPNLRRALTESRAALTLARSRGGVAGPGELVSLDALLEQAPVEQLTTFTEQLLGPVEIADENGRGGLLHTVATYFELNHSVNETATRLNVHVNTVRNRLERVKKLSGRDPQSFVDSIDLYIALWAADHKKRTGYRLIKPLT